MRAYIIEDEPHAQRALQQLLGRIAPEVEILGVAATVPEAASLLQDTTPDFIFLDVRLGDQTGFDLLRLFPEPPFNVIFVTAYDEYAVDAFKWNAIHYLTKPLNSTALRQAIEKAKKHQLLLHPEQVKGALEQMSSNKEAQHLILSYNSVVERVALEQIIRLESDSGITHFYCIEEEAISQRRRMIRKTVSLNIGHYANLLTHQFFRCHQSHIVNRKYIQLYDKSLQQIILQTGERIPVSRRGKDGLADWIKEQG